MLNLLDEELLEVGIVGLREGEGFGHGSLSFGDAAGSEQGLAKYGLDIGSIGTLLGGGLGEGEGFRRR